MCGAGWATADLLLSRLLPMWSQVGSTDFTWGHVQGALDGNVLLVSAVRQRHASGRVIARSFRGPEDALFVFVLNFVFATLGPSFKRLRWCTR